MTRVNVGGSTYSFIMSAEELKKSILHKAAKQILNASRGINHHVNTDRNVINLAQERLKRRGNSKNISP